MGTCDQGRPDQGRKLTGERPVRAMVPHLVVAMNCGNYHKPLNEQSAVVGAMVAEVVLPGFG